MTLTTAADHPAFSGLSTWRLHAMRAGYLFMGAGLALVKWPLLPDAHTLPFYEGVTLCLLTAMSLLALLGVRYPVAMLPVLLLEVTWKVLWLGLVALPRVLAGDVPPQFSQAIVNCSLVVIIAAVVPWRHVWRQFAARL